MTSPCTPLSSSSHGKNLERSVLLWSGIVRNEVLLVNAGEETDGSVVQTAQELLDKPRTPGFEFHTQSSPRRRLSMGFPRRSLQHPFSSSQSLASSTASAASVSHNTSERLRGIKFHVMEHDDETPGSLIVWVFCVVYSPSMAKKMMISEREIQGWLEQLVVWTAVPREKDRYWRYGYDDETMHDFHAAAVVQSMFAPLLLQRMQEMAYYTKLQSMHERLDSTRAIMQQNIELLLEREETLDQVSQNASHLEEAALVFKKRSKTLRRMKMMQDAKYGLMVGALVTGVVAVIAVPPILAIL